MHAFGADISNGSATNLDTEAHAKALALSRRLGIDEEIVPKSPSSELMSSLYNSGNAAFIISGPWFVGDITRDIAATPLPIVSETGEPAKPYLTVEGVFVADQAKHPTEAQAFAQWLSGPEGAAIRQQTGAQAVTLDGMPPSENLVVRAVEEQVNNAVLMPTDPTIPNVWEALERALRRVMRGAASPDAAVKEAAAYLEVFLDHHHLLHLRLRTMGCLAGLHWSGDMDCPQRARPILRAEVKEHRSDYLWVFPAGLAMTLLVALFITGAALLYLHTRMENGPSSVCSTLQPFSFQRLAHHLTDVLLFHIGGTILWTVTNLFLHVGIGIAMALVLERPWIRLRGMWRALLIIPWAIQTTSRH